MHSKYNRGQWSSQNKDVGIDEYKLQSKYDRIEFQDKNAYSFVDRHAYSTADWYEPSQTNMDKYGLKKLSDTWETRRSKYVRHSVQEKPEDIVQMKTPVKAASTIKRDK